MRFQVSLDCDVSNGQKNRLTDNFWQILLSVVLLVFLKKMGMLRLSLDVIIKLMVEGKYINPNVRL